ncbi:Dps family protein [Arcticibacterium luteifluviistationis]|uniref:DNA starvation/stationary phase protection protein n=1 Tax=Arcticibacterium luteifluviistationis TaxID=1784714 RepID=A0A2Z4GI01_9BACT|nr:DNA starvation/stationary phase protection protein [Arcticibacterium luteifluviistationis]AWW00404.1 DNA starvation/stationary phase protection protein [Arcticibacterium luteifluviistationis]
MEALIGIDKKHKTEISDALNIVLADQHILYIKLRNYHWNIEGNSFLELHEFLEKLYTGMEKDIDETAERIRKIGKNPMGSCSEFLEFTNLKETKEPFHDSHKILSTLLDDYEVIIRWIRDHVDVAADNRDYGTEDFMVGLIRNYEEASWMLRAYLAKSK